MLLGFLFFFFFLLKGKKKKTVKNCQKGRNKLSKDVLRQGQVKKRKEAVLEGGGTVPFAFSRALGKQSCDCWECSLPSRSSRHWGGTGTAPPSGLSTAEHNTHHKQNAPLPFPRISSSPWKLHSVPPVSCLCISRELLQTIPKTGQQVTKKKKRKKNKKKASSGPCLLWCGWYGTGGVWGCLCTHCWTLPSPAQLDLLEL